MKPNGGGGGGERPAGRFRYQVFRDLMRFRITDILFAATPYDSFLLEEAGELSEQLAGEFRILDLQQAPSLTNAATGEEALTLLLGRDGIAFAVEMIPAHIVHHTQLAARG